MPLEAYDEVLADVKASQTAADNFVSHHGAIEDDGITVIEIWESNGEHDAWFGANVRAKLPPGTPEPEFWEIRNSNTK